MKTRIQFLMLFFALVWLGTHDSFAQNNDDKLAKSRITVSLREKPFLDVVLRLMYRYDIPIGFVEARQDRDHNDYRFQLNVPTKKERSKYLVENGETYSKVSNHLITVEFVNAPLEEVMNEIVSQMKNYDWTIRDGVVNIFPSQGLESPVKEMLMLKLARFEFSANQSVGNIQPHLVSNIPELNLFLKSNRLVLDSDRNDSWYLDRVLDSGFEFSNLTLLELLNRITAIKRGGWVIRSDKSGLPRHDSRTRLELLL